MDTGTHIVMGIGLTALATQDPAMTGSFAATATTLIIGSLIPDGDTVLKLKDNATYISNHRGITHSIPFTILWPLLITLFIFTFLKILMLAISGYGLSLRSFFMSLLIYLIHMEPKRSDPSQINGFNSVSSIHLTQSYSSFGVSAFYFGY